uniref:Uncharacterized protein n=1 Tax=Anguilla anguilla TaxID=7936 RepID=A0A0E9QF16_ANGAN
MRNVTIKPTILSDNLALLLWGFCNNATASRPEFT